MGFHCTICDNDDYTVEFLIAYEPSCHPPTHILSKSRTIACRRHYPKRISKSEFTANDSGKENYLPIIVFQTGSEQPQPQQWKTMPGETAQSHPFQLHGHYYTLRQLLADLRDPIKADIAQGPLWHEFFL